MMVYPKFPQEKTQLDHFTVLWTLVIVFTEKVCNCGILTSFYYDLRSQFKLDRASAILYVHVYLLFWYLSKSIFKFIPHIGIFIFRSLLGCYIVGIICIGYLTVVYYFIKDVSELNYYIIIWATLMHALSSGASSLLLRFMNYTDLNANTVFMFCMTEHLGELYGAIQVSWYNDSIKFDSFYGTRMLPLFLGKLIGFVAFLVGSYNVTIPRENNALLTFVMNFYRSVKSWIRHISVRKNSSKKNEENKVAPAFSVTTFILSLIPMYVPIIPMLYMIDYKYSKYLHQGEYLRNVFFDGRYQHHAVVSLYAAVQIISLPIYTYLVIPVYKRVTNHELTTLKQTVLSFVLVGFSLVCACILESSIKPGYPQYYPGTATVRVYNGLVCQIYIQFSGYMQTKHSILPNSQESVVLNNIDNSVSTSFYMQAIFLDRYNAASFSTNLSENTIESYLVTKKNSSIELIHLSSTGYTHSVVFNYTTKLPIFWVVYNIKEDVTLKLIGPVIIKITLNHNKSNTDNFVLNPGEYKFFLNKTDLVKPAFFDLGGCYTLLITEPLMDGQGQMGKILTIVEPLKFNMVCQFLQIVFLALAEMIIKSPNFLFLKELVTPEYYSILAFFWCLTNLLSHLWFVVIFTVAYMHRDLIAYIVNIMVLMVTTAGLILIYNTTSKKNEF